MVKWLIGSEWKTNNEKFKMVKKEKFENEK